MLSLTPEGRSAVSDDVSMREHARSRAKLAIEDIQIFKGLYDRFVGNKLPAKAAMVDAAKTLGASGKPVVQITRQSEHIPFDVNTVRTIVIDTATIYSLVPKLETHKSEIAAQVRQALENPDSADNPISLYYPHLRVQLQ